MNPEPLEYRLVATQPALDELCARISGAGRIAVDTEFIRESTYFPQLCLLQIATEDTIAAIDCLAPLDMQAFFGTLLAADRSWVLHSARQDLEVVAHRASRLPQRLVDTQIAAALLGYPMQVGLQSLVSEMLGVAIGKEHTRTDWSRRPLSDAALDYALDDVRYLLPLAHALETRLGELGRLAWFEEDCARMLGQPLAPDAATILERTRGAGGLRGNRRGAALALVAWRESRAQKSDRPRRWILPDDQLVAIAARLPSSTSELADIQGLSERTVKRSGAAILDALARVGGNEPEPEPIQPEKAAVNAIRDAIKSKAGEIGIQPEVLATRRDIAALATGELSESVASGWRSELLGDLARKRSA